MLSLCWICFLLPAVTHCQSGDGGVEPRILCESDIMTDVSSLTCDLVGSGTDDDEDNDVIERLTACYTDVSKPGARTTCENSVGRTITSKDLSPVLDLNVTAHLRRGGAITTTITLMKIVKPRPPQVWNITFSKNPLQVLIHVGILYSRQYLKVHNQLFQLLIWANTIPLVQNISSSDRVILKIDMDRLQTNTQYHVKVRAKPLKYLKGTWSDWSDTVSFRTPEEEVHRSVGERWEKFTLIVCLVPLVVVTSCLMFFWRNQILTYIWPIIPHPKHALVQIWNPNKGLLLNFNPEVFSALKVYPDEKITERPREDSEPLTTGSAAGGTRTNPSCSTHSSDSSTSTTSVRTEELDLSRTSCEGEDGDPSPADVLQRPATPAAEGGHEAEEFGASQQEEAYVTMSRFYQNM